MSTPTGTERVDGQRQTQVASKVLIYFPGEKESFSTQLEQVKTATISSPSFLHLISSHK